MIKLAIEATLPKSRAEIKYFIVPKVTATTV